MRGELGGRRQWRGAAGPPFMALVRFERRVRAIGERILDRMHLTRPICLFGPAVPHW